MMLTKKQVLQRKNSSGSVAYSRLTLASPIASAYPKVYRTITEHLNSMKELAPGGIDPERMPDTSLSERFAR